MLGLELGRRRPSALLDAENMDLRLMGLLLQNSHAPRGQRRCVGRCRIGVAPCVERENVSRGYREDDRAGPASSSVT
eukprot:10627816-Alexandrium_andersonii.AAC.1